MDPGPCRTGCLDWTAHAPRTEGRRQRATVRPFWQGSCNMISQILLRSVLDLPTIPRNRLHFNPKKSGCGAATRHCRPCFVPDSGVPASSFCPADSFADRHRTAALVPETGPGRALPHCPDEASGIRGSTDSSCAAVYRWTVCTRWPALRRELISPDPQSRLARVPDSSRRLQKPDPWPARLEAVELLLPPCHGPPSSCRAYTSRQYCSDPISIQPYIPLPRFPADLRRNTHLRVPNEGPFHRARAESPRYTRRLHPPAGHQLRMPAPEPHERARSLVRSDTSSDSWTPKQGGERGLDEREYPRPSVQVPPPCPATGPRLLGHLPLNPPRPSTSRLGSHVDSVSILASKPREPCCTRPNCSRRRPETNSPP